MCVCVRAYISMISIDIYCRATFAYYGAHLGFKVRDAGVWGSGTVEFSSFVCSGEALSVRRPINESYGIAKTRTLNSSPYDSLALLIASQCSIIHQKIVFEFLRRLSSASWAFQVASCASVSFLGFQIRSWSSPIEVLWRAFRGLRVYTF